MTHHERHGERGQVLILVAVALLVLLAFAALAVDVGHLYGERRQMQNAADAAALAGARVLCENWASAATREALAETTAIDYAERNGATTVTVTTPFSPTNVVSVTAATTSTSFLAGAPPIGVPEATVGASAAAVCGAATTTCYIWPIAFPELVWAKVYSGGLGCGSPLVIIDDVKTCGDAPGDLVCNPNEVSTGGNRGWLDFAQPPVELYGSLKCAGNCGAAALRCWIDNPYPDTIDLPICIRGELGTIGSAFDEADRHEGEVKKIPLYDSVTDTGSCPGDHPILGDSCNSNLMYHVTDIACVKIKEYQKHYEIEMHVVGEDKTTDVTDVKALIVEVSCEGCDEQCSKGSLDPPQPGEAIGVSLIR